MKRMHIAALVACALFWAGCGGAGLSPARVGDAASDEGAIERAFRDRESDVQVEGEGVVERVLKDDDEGSRHQRFIVRLASGQTVLVSHNIDLAPRVEGLGEGDDVSFYGEYVWNERGGVIHWTHHDPKGRHVAGWVKHKWRTYQ